MRTCSYYFLTLDIETSTLEQEENGDLVPKAVWLSYGYCNLYTSKGARKSAGYFRTWDDLRQILNNYQRTFIGEKLLCFVHNLGYEFDFLLKNVSRPSKMLSNSTHRVISTTLEDFPQIEFRCTLMLSMHTLRYLGEQLGFEKLNSDYRFILPSDTVTQDEKKYCLRDNDVTAKYVVSLIKEFGKLREIPYTKTGRVRKTFYKFYEEHYKETKPDWDLLPPENCYTAMLDAFAGGCVFSNPFFTARLVYNVHSYDITSSYPFAMLSELFPYTIEKKEEFTLEDLNKPFWIAKIKFNDIISKFPWQWLSVSKMNDCDPMTSRFFNGKLINSQWVVRTITNVDYELIKKTYSFSSIEILEYYACEKYDKLPYPYIETIKVYAEKKARLKAIVKKTPKSDPNYIRINAEYNLAKNDFNSIYGMSVQKLMQEEYVIDDLYQWHAKEQKYKQTDKHIKRNFLYGIYITAYARKNLITAILENCPYTFVYCDTDSIKFVGPNVFKDTNKILPEEYLSIPSLSKLGRFDKDGEYTKFITYGAKKYAYQEKIHYKIKSTRKAQTQGKKPRRPNKLIYLTVAGLPHYKAGSMKIDYHGMIFDRLYNIDDFRPDIIFRKCKHGHKYITTEYSFDVDDDWEVHNVTKISEPTLDYLKDHHIETKGGVVIYDVDYALDVTETDKEFIRKHQRSLKSWLNTIPVSVSCDTKCLID